MSGDKKWNAILAVVCLYCVAVAAADIFGIGAGNGIVKVLTYPVALIGGIQVARAFMALVSKDTDFLESAPIAFPVYIIVTIIGVYALLKFI